MTPIWALGLTVLLTAELPPVEPPPCPAAGPAHANTDNVSVLTYEIEGEDPQRALRNWRRKQKDILDGDDLSRVGEYDYAWAASFHAEDGRVARVCTHTEFEINIPKAERQYVQACFQPMFDAIEAHERQHVEITRGVIAKAAKDALGLTVEEATDRMLLIDIETLQANLKFHESPEGGPLSPDILIESKRACPSLGTRLTPTDR